MQPDSQEFARAVSRVSGLPFTARTVNYGGSEQVELVPSELGPSQGFSIKVELGWRHISAQFRLGPYARDLSTAMRQANAEKKAAFEQLWSNLAGETNSLELQIEGRRYRSIPERFWSSNWTDVGISFRSGQLPVNLGVPEEDKRHMIRSCLALVSLVLTIMPLEEAEEFERQGLEEYLEGGIRYVVGSRFERDPRCRSASIAFHGWRCKACDVDLVERYGDIAADFIEVHHLKPLSQMSGPQSIDPISDLVPLCPTCHAIAHRRQPPFCVEELKNMLRNGDSAPKPTQP